MHYFCDGINQLYSHQVALGLLKLEQSAIDGTEKLIAHLVQLDRTLYVMLKNALKNQISQSEV